MFISITNAASEPTNCSAKSLSIPVPGQFSCLVVTENRTCCPVIVNNMTLRKHSDPDPADRDFFQRLRHEIDQQISGYVYEVPPGAVGTPLPADQIRSDLEAMRLCLVEPRWEEVEIRNTADEIRNDVGHTQKCVTLAEDGSYVLIFDPIGEEFHLAWRHESGLGTWGVRGDAVGCFIAR